MPAAWALSGLHGIPHSQTLTSSVVKCTFALNKERMKGGGGYASSFPLHAAFVFVVAQVSIM
jgi:hypothetical protein